MCGGDQIHEVQAQPKAPPGLAAGGLHRAELLEELVLEALRNPDPAIADLDLDSLRGVGDRGGDHAAPG